MVELENARSVYNFSRSNSDARFNNTGLKCERNLKNCIYIQPLKNKCI